MEQRILANEKKLLASLSEDDIKKLKQMLLTIYNNLEYASRSMSAFPFAKYVACYIKEVHL